MMSQATIPLAIYWKPRVWNLARSANVAELDVDADPPGSFRSAGPPRRSSSSPGAHCSGGQSSRQWV